MSTAVKLGKMYKKWKTLIKVHSILNHQSYNINTNFERAVKVSKTYNGTYSSPYSITYFISRSIPGINFKLTHWPHQAPEPKARFVQVPSIP